MFNSIESADAQNFISQQPYCPRLKVGDLFPRIPPVAADLIQQMIELDPNIRVTAEDALKHPYFEEYSDTIDVPTSEYY